MPRSVEAPTFTSQNAGSLLTTANWVDNFDRLGDGVTFKAEDCDHGGLLELCPPTLSPQTKTVPDPDGVYVAPSYADYYGATCSTASDLSVLEETASRARRGLEVRRSKKVEAALWDGSGNTAGTFTLASTDADDINSGTAVGIVSGVSQMVAALNTVLGGARGVIHVPQSLVPFLTFYGLISRNGNILQVSNTDHVYVAGTGYSGSDPDGAVSTTETWMYGTGPVNVYTSEIMMVPGETFQAVDRSVNSVTFRAEFAFAAIFNPCAHIGLPVCIPDPGPDCV